MRGNWIIVTLGCGQGQQNGTDKGMGELRTKRLPKSGRRGVGLGGQ